MGNDIYRWEDGGGRVHHCPICQTPLTHANARSRCLGEHVEWCTRYHTQLFRIGWGSQCAPCKHSEAEHHKRHREIAELLHHLKDLTVEADSVKPLKHADAHKIKCTTTPSPMSKKERKAAKKATKVSEMPKVVSTSDIEFVDRTLHPHDFAEDEAEEEKKLLEDPDIKLNLYFHKGTSNTRETRQRLIVELRDGREPTVDDAELDMIMAALGVEGEFKSAEQIKVAASIRRAVRNDLIEVAREEEATMQRKGGFWRWASTKAYKRLVQNGRIWGQKDDAIPTPLKRQDENATPKRKDSATGIEEEAADGLDSTGHGQAEEDAVAGAQCATPSQARRARTAAALSITNDITNKKAQDVPAADDGWTQVGKLPRQKAAVGTVKLSLNGGMAKFGEKAVADLGRMRVLSMQDEDEGEDY